MSINPDIKRLNKEIDYLLRERRPDRYTVSDTTEQETTADEVPDLEPLLDPDADLAVDEENDETKWLDQIADDTKHLVPESDARKILARAEVGRREGMATQRANRLLRKIGKNGQLILGWWGYENDPVAIVVRIVEPGKRTRIRQERVALRAMSPRDFRAFANEERERAASDFSARNETCAGAEWLADQMTQSGAASFLAWATEKMPPPSTDPDDASP